jgi:hypothetical protein
MPHGPTIRGTSGGGRRFPGAENQNQPIRPLTAFAPPAWPAWCRSVVQASGCRRSAPISSGRKTTRPPAWPARMAGNPSSSQRRTAAGFCYRARRCGRRDRTQVTSHDVGVAEDRRGRLIRKSTVSGDADNLGLLVWYGPASALLGGGMPRAGQVKPPAVGQDRDWGADQHLPAGAGGSGGRPRRAGGRSASGCCRHE